MLASCNVWRRSVGDFLKRTQNNLKKIPINSVDVIENLDLPVWSDGFNLHLSGFSDAIRVTNPGNTWKQSLASIALGTIHLSFCVARWHGFYARHQPRSVMLTGVFLYWFLSAFNSARPNCVNIFCSCASSVLHLLCWHQRLTCNAGAWLLVRAVPDAVVWLIVKWQLERLDSKKSGAG